MAGTITSLKARLVTPETKKVIKYSMVSVVSVVVTTLVQYVCIAFLGFRVRYGTLTASICGAVPSYYLNRMWVWGKSGKSHLRKEVIPFWIMFAVGLVFSLAAAGFAERFTHGMSAHSQSLIVTSASFFAYGALWIAKYVLFNKIIFARHPQDLDPVLDGRSGIPT